MSSVILYTDTCSNCRERSKVNLARVYAYGQHLPFVMRRVDYAQDFQREAARRSRLQVPFVYNEATGKSVSFHDLTADTINDLNKE